MTAPKAIGACSNDLSGEALLDQPQTANHKRQTIAVTRWVDSRGVRWVAEADRLPRLRLVAERLADPALRPVREIPSRAHFRLPPLMAGGAGTFIKHYRLLGWPRRLRNILPAATPKPYTLNPSPCPARTPKHALSTGIVLTYSYRVKGGGGRGVERRRPRTRPGCYNERVQERGLKSQGPHRGRHA